MRIAVNNSDRECNSKEEVERIIRDAKETGLHHIWIAGETNYPCITILRIKELARILYFENGEERIWQSAGAGRQGNSCGNNLDDVLMPESSTVPLSDAVMCAKVFWEKQKSGQTVSNGENCKKTQREECSRGVCTMEVKREERINDNGSYTIKTVKTKTKEDGFVPESEMYSTGMNHRGKYHKGYMKVTSFQTNDPRITRPFAYGISGLFILIGLFLFLFSGGITKLMALMFIGMGVFALIKSKQDIDRIEAELKENQLRDENSEQ